MARIVWDNIGDKNYEYGIDRVVLYANGQSGVAWPGLVTIGEQPSGGGVDTYYIDGVMRLQVPREEDYEATLNAIHYPPQFSQCLGIGQISDYAGLFVAQQARKPFGLCYRTNIGNVSDPSSGYKLHLVYNAYAEPSDRNFNTVSDKPSPSGFSWKVTAGPAYLTGFKGSSHYILDSRTVPPSVLASIEDILYGTPAVAAHLPTPEDIATVYKTAFGIVVVDHGDGTFTVTGPDVALHMLTPTEFEIVSTSAVPIDADSYTLSTTT